VPGLGAVADDREAARTGSAQQHLPLGVGQLLGLVDDDVRERAGEQVGIGGRQRALVDQGRREVLPRSIDITPSPSRRRRSGVEHVAHRSRWRRRRVARRGAGTLGVADRCRAASSSGRSETVHGRGVARCRCGRSSGLEPGRAPAQVGRHRPQVGDDARRVEHGQARWNVAAAPVCASDAAEQVGDTSRRSWSRGS
jgi:hypothetical protein